MPTADDRAEADALARRLVACEQWRWPDAAWSRRKLDTADGRAGNSIPDLLDPATAALLAVEMLREAPWSEMRHEPSDENEAGWGWLDCQKHHGKWHTHLGILAAQVLLELWEDCDRARRHVPQEAPDARRFHRQPGRLRYVTRPVLTSAHTDAVAHLFGDPDFLDELIEIGTEKEPAFPQMVDAATAVRPEGASSPQGRGGVMRYWSYDGCMYDTHDTEQAARDACEAALDAFRDDASDGWSEEVEHIMWGVVVQRVEMVSREGHLPACTTATGYDCVDDCPVGRTDHDYTADYALVDVPRQGEKEYLHPPGKCRHHPRYRVMRKPTSQCQRCHDLFSARIGIEHGEHVPREEDS